jgi:hypothetical protein
MRLDGLAKPLRARAGVHLSRPFVMRAKVDLTFATGRHSGHCA